MTNNTVYNFICIFSGQTTLIAAVYGLRRSLALHSI